MVIMTTSPNYDKVVRERFNAMLHAAGLFILYTAPPSDRSDRFLCCVTNLGVRRTEGLPNGSFSVSTVSLRRSGGSGAPLDDPGPDLSVMTAGLTVPGVRLRADMHKLDEQIHALDRQLQDVEQRLSRLESKMDFIESCITHRNEPAPGA